MSLQLTDKYVTVEGATENNVTIRVHADAAHRARHKAGEETPFETTKQEVIGVDPDLKINADPDKSISDNAITAGYTALKTLPEFADATDV